MGKQGLHVFTSPSRLSTRESRGPASLEQLLRIKHSEKLD
jgi:hypothetical protein